MRDAIEGAVRDWVAGGPWYWVMLKTSISHAMVWAGATLLGAVLGYLVILFAGLHPLWAVAVPLLGYAAGARFYMDREFLSSEADFFAHEGWRARVDSVLDFLVPWMAASALMYGVFLLYSVGGF